MSIRGTGALSGKYVSKYEFLGCDAVGIPSTGLFAKPLRVEPVLNEKVTENLQSKNNDTIIESKENSLMNQTTSIHQLESMIIESIQKINSTSSIIEASSVVTRTESKLEEHKLVEIPGGILAMTKVLREWEETKKQVEERLHPAKEVECSTAKESQEDKADKPVEQKLDETSEEKSELKESLAKAESLIAKNYEAYGKIQGSLNSEICNLKESLKKEKGLNLDTLIKLNVYKSNSDSYVRANQKLKESADSQLKEINNLKESVEKLTRENAQLVKYGAAAKAAATDLASRLI